MNKFIDFEMFSKIIHSIQELDKNNHILSDMIEKHLCTTSYVYVDHGTNLSNVLIEVLCKYFDIEFGKHVYDDISWWLYESVEKKLYYPDGYTLDVTSLESFYEYLSNHKAISLEHGCK